MKNGSRYPFTCNISEREDGGAALLYDLECELEIDVDMTCDCPVMIVTDVWLNGICLPRPHAFGSNKFTAALRERIRKLADADIDDGGNLWSAVCEREGLRLSGPGGDPDATWQRAA